MSITVTGVTVGTSQIEPGQTQATNGAVGGQSGIMHP